MHIFQEPRIDGWINYPSGRGSTKPHTEYKVSYSTSYAIGDRTVVRKRYSDFVALDQRLRDLTGQAPPAPLPPRILAYWPWIRTGNSVAARQPIPTRDDQLIAVRAAKLEEYLTALDQDIDPVWKLTSAWRDFWGSHQSYYASQDGRDDDVQIDKDSITQSLWTDLYKNRLTTNLRAIQAILLERDTPAAASSSSSTTTGRGGDYYTHNKNAAGKLTRAKDLHDLLSASLLHMDSKKQLGKLEIRRRMMLLSDSQTLFNTLQESVTKHSVPPVIAEFSAGTVGTNPPIPRREPKVKIGRVLGGRPKGESAPDQAIEETDRTRQLDNVGLMEDTNLTADAQDSLLHEILIGVRGLKETAVRISQEAMDPVTDRLRDGIDDMQVKYDRGRRGFDHLNGRPARR